MALVSVLDGFWAQVGGQVGAKLAPKSEEVGYQNDVKKSSNIKSRRGAASGPQGYAVVVAPGP